MVPFGKRGINFASSGSVAVGVLIRALPHRSACLLPNIALREVIMEHFQTLQYCGIHVVCYLARLTNLIGPRNTTDDVRHHLITEHGI